ncbi:MAG: hypothetical protein RMK92_04300 [Armatimonadota bacterium]|nr:hypothetical protein [Armatimonadota bacterium]
MSRRIWLLMVVAPLLFGCGSGLEEGGRIPIPNPLGLSSGQQFTLVTGSPATYTGIGSFEDVNTELDVSTVRQYVLFQTLQARGSVQGSTAPTITLRDFVLTVTVSDSRDSVTFENLPIQGQVTLTRRADGDYDVTVTSERGNGLRAVVDEQERAKLVRLARIVTSGGTNTVEATLRANVVPSLPSGTRITLTAGTGTGTLEL